MEIFIDALRGAILISGLVLVMMMLIECLNVGSHGKAFDALRGSRVGQVALSAFLGVIPGCMGGFASVSLYTHGMISFGALVAMMIASSGDEAFVMLAMFPGKALLVFGLLFVIALAVGVLTDLVAGRRGKAPAALCEAPIHEEDMEEHRSGRHFGVKRLLLVSGVALFVLALLFGLLEHGEEGHEAHTGGLNLLSEDWMNVLFALCSIFLLGAIFRASDHFVEEHLWHHIVKKHLLSIFAWTFGVLLFIGFISGFVDVSAWIGDNTALMILLATAIGIIPESGPHLVFVTLYAAGVVPLPVLLASCISQDGHAALPLLAQDRKSFLLAKAVGCAVALAAGFGSMLILYR